MRDMPKPRKPYLNRDVDRHGNVRWYFRRGKGKKIRIRGKYGTEEFEQAYNDALLNLEAANSVAAKDHTLSWLCEKYYKSAAFSELKESTQKVRKNILLNVCKTGGNLPYNAITKNKIAAGRDRRASTPSAAFNYLRIMGYLFEFAVDAGYCKTNPVKGIRKPKQNTKGLEPWIIEDVMRYMETHKIGSMAYLAMSLFLWGGFSRADAFQIGRQHEKDGFIVWDREKTGTPQYVPILPPLRQAIDACKSDQLCYLLTEHGRPFKSAAALGNKMADWCNAAGVTKRAHGLRKLSATLMAEGEGTHTQLKAMYGWKSDKMASYYTSKANTKKVALQAGEKLKDNILFPHFLSGGGD